MGLDPVTSTIVADQATKAVGGNSTQSAAAQTAASGSGLSDWIQSGAALVRGGADLYAATRDNDTKDAYVPQRDNPYYDAYMTRLMASIDKYQADHGIASYIPKENRPYELLTDAERADLRARRSAVDSGAADKPRKGEDQSYMRPMYQYALPIEQPATTEPAKAEPAEVAKVPTSNKMKLLSRDVSPYAKAALAAKLMNQDMGLDPESVAISAPKEISKATREQQAQAYQGVLDYIKRGKGSR